MQNKKAGIILVLIFLIILALLMLIGFFTYLLFSSNKLSQDEINNGFNGSSEIIVTNTAFLNPMERIKTELVDNSTNLNIDNEAKLIEKGIERFDESYINYILNALGIDKLHSAIGFGNPIILVVVDREEWSSEIINGLPNSVNHGNKNADIKVIISKEEAVKSLLAADIISFMKDSVKKGNTQIEMLTGNTELFAKGYLGMQNALTGNYIKITW